MNYPPKNPILLLCLLFFQYSILAQDKLPIKFGKVSIEDFNVKSSLIDPSVNTVVLSELIILKKQNIQSKLENLCIIFCSNGSREKELY